MTVLNVESMYVCFDVFLIQLYVMKIYCIIFVMEINCQGIYDIVNFNYTHSAYRPRRVKTSVIIRNVFFIIIFKQHFENHK